MAFGGRCSWRLRKPELGAVAVLHGHVVGRGPVVADQHRAQAGGEAPVDQELDPVGELGLDLGGDGFAVEHLCGHGSKLHPRSAPARQQTGGRGPGRDGSAASGIACARLDGAPTATGHAGPVTDTARAAARRRRRRTRSAAAAHRAARGVAAGGAGADGGHHQHGVPPGVPQPRRRAVRERDGHRPRAWSRAATRAGPGPAFAPDESTRSIQLYGSDPSSMGEAVRRLTVDGAASTTSTSTSGARCARSPATAAAPRSPPGPACWPRCSAPRSTTPAPCRSR